MALELQARVTPMKSPATRIFLKKFLAKSGESETSQEEQTKDVSSAYHYTALFFTLFWNTVLEHFLKHFIENFLGGNELFWALFYVLLKVLELFGALF